MKKIAIIGAGISGLFFANLLEENKSISYKIFERKNSIDLKDGYGIQLSVNSINLLNKIGFQKINASDLYFPRSVNFFDAKKNKNICSINLSQFNFDNNRYTTLKRSKLIEFLLNNIPKENLIFDSDLLDIKDENKKILYFFNSNVVKFFYLFGAD